ncbi:MAG TPA: DUF1566 domain-containing protein [Phycisphaerae bacterium]|nr:DUF1566 domain-containing protein [Phycisphaerae bacterium]HRW53907.1 DUF1566 domain-containing protein [Phycisphaerae bacterium]
MNDEAMLRAQPETKSHRRISCLSIVVFALTTGSALAQVTNEITSIDPISAERGTSNLLVTFTLDTDAPLAPPAGALPDSVTIGGVAGTGVTHASQYTITAIFDIPSDASPGPADVVITYSPPEGGTLAFVSMGGFVIDAGPGAAPIITTQPQAQRVAPGGVAKFTLIAYGAEPLAYQWKKDGVAIDGAAEASFAIAPVDWADAGGYRCVVHNDYGEATSDEATLIVAELPVGAYPIVDTSQDSCYDDSAPMICPSVGQAFHGQDAQVEGTQPSYTISADGLTTRDDVTGLTWTRHADWDDDGDIDVGDKLTFENAPLFAAALNAENYGGFSDWRVPSIKELYSLMDFRGTDPMTDDVSTMIPFIDTTYFDFGYGDLNAGERAIDSQWVTSTLYLDTVMNGQTAMFGVNFADGRIKGYGLGGPGNEKLFYVRLCRGNADYGLNNLVDNGDGTITDRATWLMWSKDDSGDEVSTGPRSGMTWEAALAWVQQKNVDAWLGHDDWRLPNAKELQGIVDYTRAPGATGAAAIDPIFNITQITNEAGEVDYPWFWSGTTHLRQDGSAMAGAYVCFGRGMGYWSGQWQDVHGAGCQRSDRKDGVYGVGYVYVSDGYYFELAPQGDAARGRNYVRLVRDADIPIAGDVSGDGVVNTLDIDSMVFALLNSNADFDVAYPDGCCACADVNEDGVADGRDIGAFVAALMGG